MSAIEDLPGIAELTAACSRVAWGVSSQREPNERNVRNGCAVTNEYRAEDESNNALRSSTTPGSPRNRSTSDSGVCDVKISWMSGRIAFQIN